MDFDVLKPLLKKNKSKVVLLVMDGLGGLPLTVDGKTELEAAHTPNMDALATKSSLGLHVPVGNGIMPGSGPAHIGLFGYDPLKYIVGRGVLSALGVDFDLQSDDVAARGNFCTIDQQGVVTDRRAGRIPTEKGMELCQMLQDKIKIPGVELFVQAEKEYRCLFVMRGAGLSGEISDTDPQSVGKLPLEAAALSAEAKNSAEVVKEFAIKAKEVLKNESPANMLLLRGFSKKPAWPTFEEVFGMKPLAICMYPMYRGVAKLVGMNTLPAAHSMEEEIDFLEKYWQDYDFFFVHMKKTDSAGEDGNFDLKTKIIENVDQLVPRIMALNPDVLIITGDHSTPAKLKSHSWHPVPVLFYSENARPDGINAFGERACLHGSLGVRFPAYDLMAEAISCAGRMEKFGA